jgi:membrane-anchored protein YejM (alkaline phosphatase superfamily)
MERSLDMRLQAERLRYPRAPLRWRPVTSPPNILIVVVESWRSDALEPGNMPAVWTWSRGATRFLDHRSGGNWSRSGGISLFYGLHAAYADALDDARREPILFTRARSLGFDIKAIVSRTTRFPRYTHSVFAGLPPEAVEDDLPGVDSAQKDRALVERTRAFLAGRSPGRPFLLALFIDATHLPYAFAPASVRYRPYTERLYYTEMSTPMPREPIYNRYRNAVADVDGTVGSVLEALARAGLEDDTIVVLTGDHGQEFYEHGALGHNIAMDAEQTGVPLVLKMPGLPAGDVTARSLHVDVAPTLLDRLGVLNPTSDYSAGRILPAGAGPRTTVMCGFLDCAVQDPGGATTVFRPADPLRPLRVYDASWRPAPPSLASPALPEVRGELRAFLE